MKFFLLLLVSQFFDSTVHAAWSKNWAISWAVKPDGSVTEAAMEEANVRSAWAEVNKLISELNHVPNAMVTPEYVMYRSGYVALGAPSAFMTSAEFKEVLRKYAELTPEERRRVDDEQDRLDAIMKADPWLTLLQPKDVVEANCMAISLVDGKPFGCGDVFQQGLLPSELACFERQTYIRCHLECIEKIYQKKLAFSPGRCE
jgi:hypothetical protein